MFIRAEQAARAVSVLLILALFQVYVLADATRTVANSGAKTSTPTTTAPAGMIFGKLSLPESQLILVNGNSAGSGTTIFSGAQLQTPEGTEASVQLGAAGHLDIAPNSNLTLTFDQASVDVRVTAGSAVLTTNAGVTGIVRSADGHVERMSDSANASAGIGVAPLGGARRAAAARLTKEEKASLIIIPIIIAVILIAVAAGDNGNDNNLSPSSPPVL